MGIIQFIGNLLFRIRTLGQMPRRIWRVLRFRVTAPFRMVRSAGRRFGSALRNPARYIRVPAPVRRLFERIPGIGGILKRRRQEAEGDGDAEEIEIPEFEEERFRVPGVAAEYSQIHLVQVGTSQRFITHIGLDVGRSEARLKLNEVELYFLRVNPKKYNAPVLMQAKTNKRIQVDGNELIPNLDDSLTVKIGSIISIDKVDYRVELFAWDALPRHTRVKAGWKTHTGPLHDHNEDAIGIYQHQNGYLFAVSDGVGGTYGGEVASEYTIKYLLAAFHENIPYDFDWHDVMDIAVEDVNATIRKRMTDARISNATLTAVIIQNWDAYILHIGDTRLYHYGKDGFHRITRDHYIEVERAGLNPGDIIIDYHLEKAIGKHDKIFGDKLLIRLQPGDRLLLVTDGVETVSDSDMAEIMRLPDIADVPDKLMNLAYVQDSGDNISIIAIEVLADTLKKDKWRAYPSHRVYVGYNVEEDIDFEVDHSFNTRQPVTSRTFGCLFIVLFLLCSVFYFGRSTYDSITAPPASDTPTIVAPTTRPIRDIQYTVPPPTFTPSAIPTATLEPTATPLPPTSTVRPLPTNVPDEESGG